MTRPLPTCGRISSILVLRNSAIVPVARQAADVADEVLEQLRAVGRVDHFHVELGGVDPPRVVGDDRERRAGLVATERKPGASSTTLSPWLIHTWWLSPSAHSRRTARSASLNSRRRRGRTRRHRPGSPGRRAGASALAGHSRCRGSAAAVEDRLGNARSFLVEHAAGDPERITPWGFIRAKAATALPNGAISE
jgi:hypothetical protein